MPDYELTRLGSRSFEQLVVALCHSELGPGMQVFGDGPDGGREATFNGTINWSATALGSTSQDDQWNGYTVLQAKFMLKPKARPRDNAVWLQGQIKGEIDRWADAAQESTRDRLPDYLIFVTNVDLSAVAQDGGIDKLEAFVRQLIGRTSDAHEKGLRVRAFKIWHGDQIRTMVDAHQDIRWAFDGLLTAGDVIAALTGDRAGIGTLNLDDPLRQELVAGLTADRWIRLSQAGGGGGDKLWLDEVVVDLPATLQSSRTDAVGVRAVGHVLERGNAVLRPRQPDPVRPTGVVIVGGPGNGKTTVSQLIAQAYRAAMLQSADLGPASRAIVDATEQALRRTGLTLPGNRRWPVRIDLAKYAEHLGSGAQTSLLRWISTRVSDRADVAVQPSQLNSWLRVCPWVVILDGLDEVPSLQSRRDLYEQIEVFLANAEELDADLLMVVTTRPTGYEERLPEPGFEHLALQPLPAAESASFAARLTAKRFKNDPEMKSEVATRMAAAADDPTTARLMETPLQVTVMSMIVEKFPTLPPDRFTLFNLYYQTMFDREVAKGIVISRFLADHRQHIDRVHERVGLLLQVQSENPHHADALLPPEQLREVVATYLRERGYEPLQAEQTADRVVEAALLRLVLLIPREQGLGFEIRTLQELMAARAVTEGPDEEVVARLSLLVDNPHWRNTWLLAAGRLLVLSDRFEALIAEMLRNLSQTRESLGRRLSSGPALAADLLEDGLADRRPGFKRALVLILLSILDYTPVGNLNSVAAALERLLDGAYRQLVLDRLAATRDLGMARRATAMAVMDAMVNFFASTPGHRQSIELARRGFELSTEELQAVRAFITPPRAAVDPAHTDSVASSVLLAAEGMSLSDEQREAMKAGLKPVETVRYTVIGTDPAVAVLCGADHGADLYPLLQLVEDPDLTVALELALDTLPAGHWSIPASVAAAVHAARSRRPVAEQLMKTFAPADVASSRGPAA